MGSGNSPPENFLNYAGNREYIAALHSQMYFIFKQNIIVSLFFPVYRRDLTSIEEVNLCNSVQYFSAFRPNRPINKFEIRLTRS